MQLSRATDQAEPTGALLHPVETVACRAREDARLGTTSNHPAEGPLVIAIAREANPQ
jgi:hypothetical protein